MDRRFPILLLASAILAGCMGQTPAAEPLSTETMLEYGAVLGRVLDDELVPLPNVTVALVEASEHAVSAPDGSFSFANIRVGPYTLAASHELYNETVQAVQVVAEAPVAVDLTLVKKPEYRPMNETVILQGSFECGAEAGIITGPCWTLIEGVSCGPPINYCVYDPVFKSTYEFKFDVRPRWQTLIAELTWTSGTTSMDGMRLYVENANVSAQGLHGKGVAKVHGNQQPLTARIDRGVPAAGHETYDGTRVPAYIPDEGGLQQIRVFPKGQGYQYTSQVCHEGQCFLGVGAGLGVRFTVHLTIFYNEAAPAGFSAIPRA